MEITMDNKAEFVKSLEVINAVGNYVKTKEPLEIVPPKPPWLAPMIILDWMNQGIDRLGFTPREREVVVLMCKGCRDDEIADIMKISVKTIKHHNQTIYKKASVNSRVQLFVEIFGL